MVVRSATKVTAEVLASAKNLKVVGRAGIGVDNIDIEAASANGVVVMNTPFGNAITTAEHAIAMMFALARQIPSADQMTQSGKWEKSRFMGVELTGKTLGIIGCGNIGSRVAERAIGLKMRVVAYDPFLTLDRSQDLGAEKVELEDGERKISIEKGSSSLEVQFNLKYKNKIIGNQKNKIDFQKDDLKDVINSRTFCLYEDIEKIRKLGLAKGGSLENALVVDEDKILNHEGLRNENEFVNHKILDCLGDIYLAGYRMVGKITSSQGGHNVTNQGLRELFSNNENFSILELKEKNIPHSFLIKNPLKSSA